MPAERVTPGLIALLLWLCSAVSAQAQTASKPPATTQTGSDSDLATQLSNPVAGLVSVPFQFNWDQPVGTRYSHTRGERWPRLTNRTS